MAAWPWKSLARSRQPTDGGDSAAPGKLSLSLSELFVVGTWFGVATGLLELGGTLAAVKLMGRVTYDTLRTNWHYFWMTPLSNLVLFSVSALVLCVATARIPRLRTGRVVFFLYAYLTAWSLVSAIPTLHKTAEVVLAIGLACVTTKFLTKRRSTFLRIAPRAAILGAGLILAIAGVDVYSTNRPVDRGPSVASVAAVGPPNVVLIVLDTVRADSLTPYGAERDTTPNLARLAREGVLFKHARSTAPWTLPSHASLFTGRWPFELSADVGRPLDSAFPTLAEQLADRGYATGGFVANTQNCNAWYGLDRGFDHYEDFYENATVTPIEVLRSSRLGRYVVTSKLAQAVIKRAAAPVDFRYRKTAGMINRDALAWLSDKGDQPFFMFLNYFDVHDPYQPPKEAERRFTKAGGEAQSAANLARDAYDDCLVYLDSQIGRLLAELESRGKLQNTLVIVTSDHGEGFGEHGLAGHGVSLYRSELHIPLMLVHPTRTPAGTVVSEPVSLRDVAPTILDLLDLGTAPTFAGKSLANTWSASAADRDFSEPVLSEVDRADHVPAEVEDAPARRGRMRSITANGRTYILNGDGREELYDLHDDPEESNDLADLADAQEHLHQLRELMEQVTGVQENGE
ncbi:sulfatase [Paludisphaera borealis]|uniref:Arylsulfatase n=1 Tax=Paludisphaera borealis TaxID=1387353 RepID=A0A1U7CLZ6_9BACT|nr:sulfatase [Paludisphaera borealis]APW59960.1 Arylsulfatase [Paludisphaera borealis]